MDLQTGLLVLCAAAALAVVSLAALGMGPFRRPDATRNAQRSLEGAEHIYDAMARAIPGASKVCFVACVEGMRDVATDAALRAAAAAVEGASAGMPGLRTFFVDGSDGKRALVMLPHQAVRAVTTIECIRASADASPADAAMACAEAEVNTRFRVHAVPGKGSATVTETASLRVFLPCDAPAGAPTGGSASAHAAAPPALLLTLHHGVCDGVSGARLLARLAAHWAARVNAPGGDAGDAPSRGGAGAAPMPALHLGAAGAPSPGSTAGPWAPTSWRCIRATHPHAAQRAWLAARALAAELAAPPPAVLTRAAAAPMPTGGQPASVAAYLAGGGPMKGPNADAAPARGVRTRLVPRSLGVDETRALRRAARARGVTVNAALDAAGVVASRAVLAAQAQARVGRGAAASGDAAEAARRIQVRCAVSLRRLVTPPVPDDALAYLAGSACSWHDRVPSEGGSTAGAAFPGAAAGHGAGAAFWDAAARDHAEVRATVHAVGGRGGVRALGVPLLKEFLTSTLVARMADPARDPRPATVLVSNIGDVDAVADAALAAVPQSSAGARPVRFTRVRFCSSVNAWRAPEVTAATSGGQLHLTFALPTPVLADGDAALFTDAFVAALRAAASECER